MSLADLPTELYSAILYYVPSEDLQQVVLALTRALPLSSIPLNHLFESIRIKYPEQAIRLHRRLRIKPTGSEDVSKPSTGSESPARWVRELSVEGWAVDAEVILNIVKLVPRLSSLNLWIGPNNFAPEHLEELFVKPLPGLRYLGLRFRPYVQKATYYQFLKGAYFDSTLLALSQWPPSKLPTLSIVQDPIDSGLAFAARQAFAQPLVFFRLDPYMSLLLHSPAMSGSLKALRLRIPSRSVARSLCVSPSSGDALVPMRVPELEILDLSTSGLLEEEVDKILVRFKNLKHLILDHCSVLRGELREGEWGALGKRCALVGARRAKEREKSVKTWLESHFVAEPVVGGEASAQVQGSMPRRARRGRRGLATATVSLRSPSPAPPSKLAPSSSEGRRPLPKIRIIPPLPSLATLCVTTSPLIKSENHPAIRAEFEAGWSEGVAQLAVTRARLKDSSQNGVRVMRFSDCATQGNQNEGADSSSENGFNGLGDIDKGDLGAFAMSVQGDSDLELFKPPVLCFAGGLREGDHVSNCGHCVGWSIWEGNP